MTINKTTNKTATDTLEEAQQLTAEAVQDVCRGLPGSHGALIIGPSGQGKTHAVDTTARAEPLIVRNPHKGRVSAKGLYETLSEHSLSGHITILDDAEHDLNDDEALALLCCALWGDSTGKRTISWTIGSAFARGGKKNAAVTSGASPPPAAPLTHPAVPYDGGIIIIANSFSVKAKALAVLNRLRRVHFNAPDREVFAFMRKKFRAGFTPTEGGITVPPAECEQLIDYLEAQGHAGASLRAFAIYAPVVVAHPKTWKTHVDHFLADPATNGTLLSSLDKTLVDLVHTTPLTGMALRDEWMKQTGRSNGTYYTHLADLIQRGLIPPTYKQ